MAECVKVVLLGDAGVGKKRLVAWHTEQLRRCSLIGIDFTRKVVKVDKRDVAVRFCLIQGSGTFKGRVRSYVEGAHAVILVYDITSKTSFESLHAWTAGFSCLSDGSTVCMLVGNKTDRQADRQVPGQEAHDFAAKNGMIFIETSAETVSAVDDVFPLILRKAVTVVRKEKERFCSCC